MSYITEITNEVIKRNVHTVISMFTSRADVKVTLPDNYFDRFISNLFVPHINYPTRITIATKTQIENIFSNSLNFSQGTSGNLTLSISDHLAQFLIIPEECYKLPKRNNIFKHDTNKFDKENFILDLLNVDWPSIISVDKKRSKLLL